MVDRELKLTQSFLDSLIICPKEIIEPPKKEMQLLNGSWRNSMKLKSKDGKHEFTVFMRKNEAFEEDFSIGLVYHTKEKIGDIILARYNGPHDVVEDLESVPHFGYHIHTGKAENIEKGMKPERGGLLTKKYASYQEALMCALADFHITNAGEHFPTYQSPTLFGE
ncbi:hypothetical protein HY768_00280 [candidate division TA06 bacterium]|uniref:Uncharacterized protein n=1 Tax=candidate division TA06 bacterium TaxID=2250710 RepID=A0A933MJH0_UNCT6|nr:hypothetical protein [candidate division TA06 bacterium]